MFYLSKYNPGKSLHRSQEHFLLPLGPLEVWQLDFVQMPPSQGYKYVLVTICMFSHWVERFPCRRVRALMVGNLLLET